MSYDLPCYYRHRWTYHTMRSALCTKRIFRNPDK